MPLLLGQNPNPSRIFLGNRELRKIMLGDTVRWQKGGTSGNNYTWDVVSLEGLLRSVQSSDNKNVDFPMYMFRVLHPPRNWGYRDKLTFIPENALFEDFTVRSLDWLLVSDVFVTEKEIEARYPMFFFNGRVNESYDPTNKLTFCTSDAVLSFSSMDNMLVAVVDDWEQSLHYPMQFLKQNARKDRSVLWLNYLSFIADIPDEDWMPTAHQTDDENITRHVWEVPCFCDCERSYCGSEPPVHENPVIPVTPPPVAEDYCWAVVYPKAVPNDDETCTLSWELYREECGCSLGVDYVDGELPEDANGNPIVEPPPEEDLPDDSEFENEVVFDEVTGALYYNEKLQDLGDELFYT